MDAINFVLALLALIVGGIAFARTGGIRMLHSRVEEARDMAANALERMEGKLRSHEEAPEPKAGEETRPPPTEHAAGTAGRWERGR